MRYELGLEHLVARTELPGETRLEALAEASARERLLVDVEGVAGLVARHGVATISIDAQAHGLVITSYSIHYTKLYDIGLRVLDLVVWQRNATLHATGKRSCPDCHAEPHGGAFVSPPYIV